MNQFSRGYAMRSEHDFHEFLATLRDAAKRAEEYSLAGNWPCNTESCTKYFGCEFAEVCRAEPEIKPGLLSTLFTVDKWCPMEER